MQDRKSRSHTGAHWLPRRWILRHWLLIAVVVIASVLVLARQPLLAADSQPAINQTVPPPTPKPEVPNPGGDNGDNDNNDNNNDNNNNDANAAAPVEQPAPAAAAAAVTSTSGLTATVDVLTLNVRQGPGTTFPVIGKLTQGSVVSVEAVNSAGDWWQICCVPGTETRGWVSAALVVPSFAADQAAALPLSDSAVEAAPLGTAAVTTTAATTGTTAATTTVTTTAITAAAPTLVEGAPTATVAGVNLNVRSGPGTDSPVVAKLRANDVVSVMGRNAAGDWLYICCVGSPAGNGWVSAQFVTPSFTADELKEVAGGSATAPAATTATTAQGAAGAAGETSGASGLSVAIAQQPPFAVQGREIALVYTVRNDTTSDLADVMLRSELPGPLTLVGASASGGQVMSQDAPLVEITFPVLAAGQSATATVRVRVANDVPNGTTFANFATVTGGAETASSGITIGMPPSLLPEFW